MTAEGDLLYEPSAERVARSQMCQFLSWLSERGLTQASSYAELHAWSVADLPAFWAAFATWSGVIWRKEPDQVLVEGNGAEGARWFTGAELNYADHVLRQPAESPALVALHESGSRIQLTYGELTTAAGAIARGLQRLGVTSGDRVAAVLPNGVEAVVGFLAAASIGAVWSACAPEFGSSSMTDRFQQIAPRVLLVADTYTYGGRVFSLSEKTETLAASLPGLGAIVRVPARDETGVGGDTPTRQTDAAQREYAAAGPVRLSWAELAAEASSLSPVPVNFDHPLWILYSSGTTGLPKPIIHGHGGIVLEHLKAVGLHSDLGPGDRFFWFSTTGWMMWNFLVGGLLCGATIVCYDGSPVYPDQGTLWRLAAENRVTFFGTSAAFIEACRKAGISPIRDIGLPYLRSIGSTGAPLSPEGFAWASDEVGSDVLLGSVSGGTDVCTAFLHTCPMLPVHAGELQCAALGCAVEAFDPQGHPLIGEVGELVVTSPMPSMPVGFWGDADGSRLHEAYFAQFPGVWRHGDWVKRTQRDTFVVYGRSDATLNRGGVRMGTSEFYRVVEAIDGVKEALVLDTTELGREGELICLVALDDEADAVQVTEQIEAKLRSEVSPRHVPDRVIAVKALPRTLNGKKVEVPIRRILLGTDPAKAVSKDSIAEPAALDDVIDSLREAGLL